jgi:hypothetical protein
MLERMAQALTVLELSERCGEPAERLLIWRSTGLVGTDGTGARRFAATTVAS